MPPFNTRRETYGEDIHERRRGLWSSTVVQMREANDILGCSTRAVRSVRTATTGQSWAYTAHTLKAGRLLDSTSSDRCKVCGDLERRKKERGARLPKLAKNNARAGIKSHWRGITADTH